MFSQIDTNHMTIEFSGYNSAPSITCFEVLHQVIEYLYHHPHVLIIYPRKQVITPSINVYFAKGKEEIINVKKVSDNTSIK